MNALIEFLTANGMMLVEGATVLLLLAAGAVLVTRSPVHRQRLCEAGVFACAVWLVLACVPMRRAPWGVRQSIEPARPAAPLRQAAPPRQSTPSDLRFEHEPAGDAPPVFVQADPRPMPLFVEEQPLVPSPTEQPRVSPAWVDWPAEPATAPLDWPRVLAIVFLSGSAVSLAWLGLGHVLVWRMLRRAEAAPAWVSAIVREVLPDGAVEPHVRVVSHLARPASLGTFGPVILLPKTLLRDGSAARVRQVILHELGHVLRRDAVGNAIFNLALAVLWFHPLYWWLRGQASFAREMVADDWAAAFDGKEAYVAELVRLARSRIGGEGLAGGEGLGVVGPAGTIGIFGRGSDFFRRMRMLLQNDDRLAVRCSRIWRAGVATVVVGAIALGATFAGVRPVRADDEPTKPAAPAAVPVSPVAPVAAPAPEAAPLPTPAAAPVPGEVDHPAEPAPQKVRAQYDLKARYIAAQEAHADVAHEHEEAAEVDDDATDLRDQMKALQKARDDLAKQVAKLEADIAKIRGNKGDNDEQRMKELADQRAEILMRRSELDQKLADIRAKSDYLAAQRNYRAAARDVTAAKRATATVKPMAPAAAYGRTAAAPGAGNYPALTPPAQAQIPARTPWAAQFGGRPGAAGAAQNQPAGFGGGEMGVGTVHLDLVNLANSVADASGAVRIAEAQLKVAARAEKVGAAAGDVATAEAQYQAARKRQELLRGIASLALEGAARDLQRFEKLADQGLIPQDQFEERRSKVQMLKLIYESANDGGGGGGGKAAR
jgi:hypothetical protein